MGAIAKDSYEVQQITVNTRGIITVGKRRKNILTGCPENF